MTRALALLALFALALVGCVNFDREDQVHDMRVLGIRTEPAEILYTPLFLTPASQRPPGFPLPTVDVDVQVFAFDPRGGNVDTSIQLCPEGQDGSCRLYNPADDIAHEPAAARADVRALVTPQTFTGAVADARVQPNEVHWTFSPAIIDFLIPDSQDGSPIPSIFPLLPRVAVEETNTDADPTGVVKERAFKRIPVAMDLTSSDLPPNIARDLAAGLGITLCAQPIPPEIHDKQGVADCLEARVPNVNPDLRGFHFEPDPTKLTEGTATDDVVTPDLGPSSLLRANPGASIVVTPVFAPNTVERYQVVSFDLNASKIILLNRVEDLACNWYSTRGDVSSGLTALQNDPGLGISWHTPSNAKSGERDTLILVVLDQRGGTAVGTVAVEYR